MSDSRKLKIIVLGEQGVGKTALLVRYKDGTYREKYKFTSIDRFFKPINVNNTNIMLELWDTAGFDRFRSFVKGYFRGSDGVLLIYDVTDMTTFTKLESWLKELRTENETATVIIVGNKNDDPDRRMVNRTTVRNYARDENLEYIETSAKTGENVNRVFEILVRNIIGEGPIAIEEGANNADLIRLHEQNGVDCTDSLNRKGEDLPPIVLLSDDSIIKLCAETDKLRNVDDSCCVIS